MRPAVNSDNRSAARKTFWTHYNFHGHFKRTSEDGSADLSEVIFGVFPFGHLGILLCPVGILLSLKGDPTQVDRSVSACSVAPFFSPAFAPILLLPLVDVAIVLRKRARENMASVVAADEI